MDIFLTGEGKDSGVVIKDVEYFSNERKRYKLVGQKDSVPLLDSAKMFKIEKYWNNHQ